LKDVLFALLYLVVVAAKRCGPGGVRAVIAENLLLKQQLIVLRRARRRAPNLTLSDRLLCGFGSLFLDPGRIRKLAIAQCPSTLLAFHQAFGAWQVPPVVLIEDSGTCSNVHSLPDDEEFETHWLDHPTQYASRPETTTVRHGEGCDSVGTVE
jgi:hypothetical protein